MDLLTCSLILLITCATMQALGSIILARIKNKNKILPPGPPRLPIIGNLLELGRNPHQSMAKLAKIYGPIMTLKLGQVTTIVISSAEMAKEVLQTHDHTLSLNRTVPQSVHVVNHEKFSFAFLPISPLWKELRRICNGQLFAHKTLDESQHVRRARVQQLLHDVHECSQKGEAIDIGTEAFKITINLLSNTIFSQDFAQTSGSAGEFKDVVTNITKLVGSPNMADFFPVLRAVDPQGVRRQQTKNVAKVLDIFNHVINKRLELRDKTNSINPHNDMLDSLLNISKDNEMIDNNMIQHLAHDLFVAGTDTTSSTLEWALTELILNPEIMSKAKKELHENIGKAKLIEESDIPNLPYLQAIIKETFRLHPPVPLLLPRKAERDVEICGFTIPKDAQVFINVWNIGRDPNLWDNPTVFSPDRFIGSDIDIKGRNFELVPFGAGRRICPGMMLAIRMLHLMLGSLLNSFDWKLEDGMEVEDIDMEEKFGITLQKAQPLRIVPLPI